MARQKLYPFDVLSSTLDSFFLILPLNLVKCCTAFSSLFSSSNMFSKKTAVSSTHRHDSYISHN